MADRPYLYQSAIAVEKSHQLSMSIIRKELNTLGFENGSSPTAWEQLGVNSDTLVVLTCVPLSASRTYIHVTATSNNEASSKHWHAEVKDRIENSKMVLMG